ncbi:GNAT family N-acetyltransferase [Vibrio vulnificus]|uniref:GNAT family N-acetyltransferase/peptidase C39 family protein n=1 Tax=Vibrio TaxID=662 RepID=UPI000D3E2403|nr:MULTISPECIES: GNAT family N-acetyltransferase/peptidase C39 family protein [Vibrio]EGQ7930839.1 GNAT family N-acetyltransferase [Vibrio vulnificus]EGQ9282485.1 GNAT family N-acetyltransferase [Vibrio vulnificus]EGQ9970260.1 GNAT family N-acetyltransferase [Vibrio vulnificus]EGR0068963.1 GNAT family N-acetyltransferase [Vibrio vulnificus]EIJ0941418.1 GNAT family N-acetyltransferase/peptidase C39 family protein [Vibrio vulnificus]
MDFRVAKIADLDALNRLERELFVGDRIAPRQMKRFIQSEHAVLLVADSGQQLAGYALLLFHQGTQLSRLYSIAVRPEFRGQKIAQSLIELCEQSAIEQGFTTLRLEVREDNSAAINLYKKLGYQKLKILIHYYDDLSDGIRMQKRLAHYGPKTLLPVPLYVQTTPFTCGAACLLMAFAHHDASFQPSRKQELQLWREATTIFMAAGHGGCSGHGLALAAARRGYTVELWSHAKSTPFIDSVRDENKKQVIEIVHQDFCQQLEEYPVSTIEAPPSQSQLEEWISMGASVLLLISTYRFNGSKEPHWVLLSGMSERFFFIHDPHAESEEEAMASAHVTVSKKALAQIIGFGKQKHTACVVIHPDRVKV